MWKPSRRALLGSLGLIVGAGYGGGRVYCNETGCADEQSKYLLNPTLSPAWTQQVYDPCEFCRNDPADKFDQESLAIADSDTLWTTSGGVSSRSPASGDVNWKVNTAGGTRPYAISYTDKTVFIVGGPPGHSSGQPEATVDRETGDVLYKDKLPESPIEMVPVLDGETEIACRESHTIQLLAYNARTGDFQWGTDDFTWTSEFNVQRMAAGGGHIYLSGTDEQNQREIMALNSESGEPDWRFSPDRRPVWLRFSQGCLLAMYGTTHVEKPGTVICLDATNGTRNWEYSLEKEPSYEASIERDSVVLSDAESGTIHILDLASGDHRWGTQIDERIIDTPKLTESSLFIPYKHSNNPILPEVEHGLYRYNLDTRELTGQRVFYDRITDIAASEKYAFVLSGPSIWGFN